MTLALIAATLVGAVGVALMVAPADATARPIVTARQRSQMALRATAAVTVFGVVFVVSRWFLPAIVVGAGTYWLVASYQARSYRGTGETERLDALASWVESVRDVLLAGEQPIGAIRSSVAACPSVIRAEVRRLSAGLGHQDPTRVFRRFADDIDDPVADLVAAGLSIAVRRGARTVPVLTALAEQTRHQVDRRRLIIAERAPAQREVQALTVIMGTLMIALLMLGRSEYLDAYDQSTGQIFLAGCLAGYVALIVRVQQLAAFPRPARFVTTMGSES